VTAARCTCWRRWTPTPRGPGQRQAPGAPQEVPALAPLLAPLHRTGVMVTADTLPTHPTAAEFPITCKQATTWSP
jgi:hypothetical protein